VVYVADQVLTIQTDLDNLQREVERSQAGGAPRFHPPEYWEDYERASNFHRSWAARRANELDLDALLDFWNREGS
jgi:hypothetical protein